MILLDGGKGHVAAVRPVLEALGLQVPLFGMVKDDKHRTRAIARDGGEIAINSSRQAFTLVSQIQDGSTGSPSATTGRPGKERLCPHQPDVLSGVEVQQGESAAEIA